MYGSFPELARCNSRPFEDRFDGFVLTPSLCSKYRALFAFSSYRIYLNLLFFLSFFDVSYFTLGSRFHDRRKATVVRRQMRG